MLKQKQAQLKMLLQIHDELLFECPEDEVATLVPEITQAMQHAVNLDVALKVSVGMGKSWGDV